MGGRPREHAADTGSLSGWLDKRLSEEASGPVGSFLPVAKYDADPDADLGAADINAADPLAALRRDIGAAKGQTLLVESQMSVADSPASAPRRDLSGRAIRREPSARSRRAARARHPRRRQCVWDPRVRSSTARRAGKRRANRGGSLSRRRWTGCVVASRRKCSHSSASRCRLIRRRSAGVTCKRGRRRSADWRGKTAGCPLPTRGPRPGSNRCPCSRAGRAVMCGLILAAHRVPRVWPPAAEESRTAHWDRIRGITRVRRGGTHGNRRPARTVNISRVGGAIRCSPPLHQRHHSLTCGRASVRPAA